MNTGTPEPANAMSSAKPALTTKPRSFFPIAIIAIFVIAVMAAALLLTVPTTNAAPITLTKNTGQATHATTVVTLGTGTSDDSRAAQSFTTGTNTDGYTVSAIGIKLATLSDATNAGTDLKLELYSHSGSSPDSALCTLSDPASFTGDAVNEFAAPTGTEACPRLLSNTVYYAVLERVATTTANSTVTVSTTANNTEDTGGATGWSVGNNAQKYATAWAAISNNSLQVEVKGEAVTNVTATGQPGIVDAANPDDSLDRLWPGMTLAVATDTIMDDNGLTSPVWNYQWAHDDRLTVTDISGETSNTYEVKETDIGKSFVVKLTFQDDLMFDEGPLSSSATRIVGPSNLITWNTGSDLSLFGETITLTAATPRAAQSFNSTLGATEYTLDYIELDFVSIGDTSTIADGLQVTLNADSSGAPGSELCTLANPGAFAGSGVHRFHAPAKTISTLCPKLEKNSTYHVIVERKSSYTSTLTLWHVATTAIIGGGDANWKINQRGHSYSTTTSAWTQNTLAVMVMDIRARPEFELEALTETEVPFGWGLTPTGIVGGQPFRLLFLTDDESPTSTDIDVYNEFVQAQAAGGHADIQEHAGQFRVLGSTAADDARDNTETTSSDTDAPIYWLDGAKVADNYADLYDAAWDEEVNRRTAAGDLSTDSDNVWTGSDNDGTGREETGVSVALGETSVRQGEMDNSSSTLDPLSASTVTAATNTAPFYALSGIFRVEPNTEATIGPLGDPLAVKRHPRVGDELYTNFNRSTITDPEGVPSTGFHIQWFRYDPATDTETEIEGATQEPYYVTHTDAEHQLSFTMSFTDNQGNPETLVSERSEPVLPYDVLLRNKPGHDEVAAPLNATVLRYAQKFNTGTRSSGYHVESIGFHLSQVDDPNTAGNHLLVRLQLPDDDGNPDKFICTLRDPATFSAPGIHHFTNPPSVGRCPNLEPNTDYFAVIHRTVTNATDIINVTATTETDEAEGSSTGWTIEDASLRYTNNAWEVSPSSHRAVIEVKGDRAREITIPIDSPLIPDGLSGGSFRLIFVAGESTATGGDILRYQADLSDALADANTGEPETLAVRQLDRDSTSNIRLLASTDEVDARDHTFSTYTSSHKGVPIFWYKGSIVADDYEDFYDGGWQNENQPRDWHGESVTDLNQEYWTGSNDDGTAKTRGGVSKALGQSEVEAGKLNETGSSPLSHAAGDPTQYNYLFAITGILKIENHPPQGLPSITGVPRVGETLTADTSAITDANGIDQATFTYQWLKVAGADAGPITGATSKTFPLTADLAGKQITVRVGMTDDRGYYTLFQSSAQIDPTEPVVPTEVLVRNTAQTRNATGSDFDNQSPTKMAQSFTTGAGADGYALTSIGIDFKNASPASTASSRITATLHKDSSGEPGDELCTLVDPPTFTSSGLQTFSVPTAGADRCANLAANTTYWIVLENDSSTPNHVTTTNVQDEDAGSLTDWSIADSHHEFSGSFMDWVFSASPILIEVRGVNAVPNITATGVPTISGTPQEGSTLTADTSGVSDSNGLPTSFSYQWVRVTGTVQTDIDGATASTYTLTEDDLDQTIIVRVSFIDQDGHPEGPLSSAPTGIVTAPNLLVKNTLAGVNAIPTQASDPRIGQAFTTGSSLGGYQLASVGFRLHAIADPATAGNDLEVTLNEVATSGEPGAALCTLEDPGTFVANSINRFSAPSGDDCPKLSRNTTYFAVLHRVAFTGSNAITVGVATGSAQDEGSAANWSIADSGYFGTSTTWLASLLNYRIEVTGEEGIEVEVPQGWSLTPSGLVGRDQFRLLFLTEPAAATDTDIADYNTYVQEQAAAGHTDIQDFSSWFRVLGSTEDVDARDNTGTTSANPNSKIYWLNGSRVANNYGNLYRSFWDDEANPRNRAGTIVSTTTVWTGSRNDGTASLSGPVHNQQNAGLGATSVRTGQLNAGLDSPLHGVTQSNTNQYPFYALSNIFVVPNTPATGQPAVTGTPRVNETLTADTSGITDPEGITSDAFFYNWIRVDDADQETDIDGATRSTYRPTDEDADKRFKVRVYFTDDQGFDEGPFTSEATALIAGRDVLVRNTGQSTSANGAATKDAQAFTTGTNPDGYILESIGFNFHTIASTSTAGDRITVTLNQDNNGSPGSTLCTLIDPPTFASSGVHTFTSPTSGSACPGLDPNETYYAVIVVSASSNPVNLRITNSTAEDLGSVPGWSIGDTFWEINFAWVNANSQFYMIEVKGRSSAQEIESDHTTWVDNRQGQADTGYANTGSFSIAQGFRTGDTAGIFNINEIHIDFDGGQSEYQKIKVHITESTTPDAEVNTGTPSGFRKGGLFYTQEVHSDGTVTFPRHSGYKWLEANTNYFLIISSTSDDPGAAPTLRMTEYEGQDSSDGWSIDDQSYSKAKADGAQWTRRDHQVRFRISGEYHQGLSLYLEPTKYESCPNKPCVVAVLETTENMDMEGRRFPGSLDSSTTWISTQENIEFKAALWPIPTAGQWVEFDYDTDGWTATAGEDFHNASGTVRFSAGDKLETIKVELIDDSIEDSGELLRMHIGVYLTTTSAAGRTYQPGDLKVRTGGGYPFPEVTKYSAFGTILNSEEETETRRINVSGVTITEGVETTAEFTVSLTGTLTAPVWFDYATVDGSAVAGTHYTATSGETHIPHGATSVTVPVPILDHDDDVYTGDRKFTLQLSNVTVAATGTDSATATIRDDDPQPLTASFTNLPEGNHGESAFKFDISFNQDVATQHLVMQEDAMTVTNGEVTGAQRVDGARNLWRITVQPVDGRDVTVELPATTDCSAAGAVCTGGDNPQPLSNGITHTFLGTQLNAGFEGFDFHHDGSTPMQFRLTFSEEVDTTAAEIKDHALTVTGATINTVVQKDEGSTRRWNVTVTPTGTGPFDVVLAQATDCALDGHICTADGELLARGDWKRSSGPPVISVADAAVTEGDGAQLTFAVTLDRNWSGPIPTVSYATSDGTASAGSDYTAGSGSLTLRWTQTGSLIRPWTLAGAITVPVTNDTLVEETETLTLTLSSPVWATLGDAVATGAIEEDDVAVVREPDTAPTGLPVITGTPEADSALTADTSAIDDANGLTGVSYSYQWIVTTDGADADVGGATASTYTPRTAHVGRTLKVRVTFTDDDDYEHTLTSEPTTPITKPADTTVWSADMLVVEYTDISIGAASADLFSNIGGTGNLQIKSLWSYVPDSDLRLAFTDTFDDAEDHTLIVGDLTLEFPAGSSGEQSFKWTNVELGWEDGQTIAVSIVPTTPAEPVANTAATGQATISGTPQVGQSLTAGTADIGDADGLGSVSYNYQWLAGDANIQHATARTYTPGVNDVGKTIRVKVSFTDDRGNAETLTSIATAAVLATVPTAPQGLTVTQGSQIQELDASWQAPSSNGGSAVTGYRVQWKEAADSWDTEADVSQATVTGTTYTITGLTGGVEYAVRVMATNDEGDGPASTEARGTAAAENNAPTGLPSISGTAQVGETLTASTSNIDDEDGLDNVSYSYQWARNDGTDDTDIAGETGSTYALVDADQGQTIKVRVTFTDDAGNDESLTSAATETVLARPNRAATGLPTISGTPQVEQTLTADTSGISDEDGLSNVSYAHQWSAGGSDIDGATGSTYTLTASEQGQTIQVQVTFTDDADNEETLTSQATVAVAAASNREATGQPAIGGTPQVEQTLTADTAGITDADGLTNVSYEYQWLASGTDIDGATGPSYVLTSSEQGQTIQVRVTFTDDADNDESLTSAATETVLARPNRAAAGLPTISGTPQVDQTLTADTSAISDEDGLTNVSWSYQWTAGGTDIEGATSSTYTLVFADQGKTIEVKVSFTDDADNAETLTSVATLAVAAAPNRDATGKPTIGGTPQVDQTLTADTSPIDDADGLTNATFEYQWVAGGSDIAGATGSSHTLTASQQGKTIQVQVTFTDDRGNAESLTSEPTDAVAAKPTPLTVRLKVAAPASHDGSSEFTFEIEFSEEFGISYATLRDHAFNVTGGSVEKAQRTDKPSNIPWRIEIKPQGNGAVTIELPATTDCNADGAICTGDGRKLSNSLSFTVSGLGG